MDDIENSLSGITAEFGFVYQRMVFLRELIEHCNDQNDYFHYEGVDDVDSCVTSVEGLRTIKNKRRVIQCKTGVVTSTIFDKAIMNWVLLTSKLGLYDKYVLYSENELSFPHDKETVIERIRKNVVEYLNSGKRKTEKAILYRISHFYNRENETFSDTFLEIIDHVFLCFDEQVFSYMSLKTDSFSIFCVKKCPDVSDNLTICKKRFESVSSTIRDLIDDNEQQRKTTSISFSEYSRMNNIAVANYNEKNYSLDISEFRKANQKRLMNNERIMQSREALFLNSVYSSEKHVLEAIIKEYYYRDLRDYYDSQGMISRIQSAELEAYERYIDTEKNDDLYKYFTSVVGRNFRSEIITNDSYNKGCFVFLSSDDCEESVFIDWGGKNAR